MDMTRYIFITGGVVSSLGKGLASAALGALLQARGFSVRLRKLDPYLNVDPGTMSPFEHGEVFVTDDLAKPGNVLVSGAGKANRTIIDLPEGAAVETTDAVAQQVAQVVMELPEVLSVQTHAGAAAPFNFNGLVRHYYLRHHYVSHAFSAPIALYAKTNSTIC